MSERINTHGNRATFRWKLLTTASMLALAAASCEAARADEDRPLLWIELGGQFERQTGQGEMQVPPFVANFPDSAAFKPISISKLERVPLYSEGLEGTITFQPEQSDWVLSAGIKYGRSSRHRDIHQGQLITAVEKFTRYPRYRYISGQIHWDLPKTGHFTQQVYEFAGTQVSQSQKHMVLDFSAGKDVGLGMMGQSTLNLGVRIAQFVSNSSIVMHARPDAVFYDPCFASLAAYFAPIFPSHNFEFCFPAQPGFHTFAAASHSQRKFQGVGPSISWNASTPVVGNLQDEALTIDWAINAAILFGRQRAKGGHRTSGTYDPPKYGAQTSYQTQKTFDRSRRIMVPNVGGTVGLSLAFPNAKVSIGYRGDFFFGAMDKGIDSRKTGITGFYGPFASISIGLGD